MTFLMYTQLGIAILLCVAAAATDVRDGRISNWITLPCLAIGLVVGFAASGSRGILTASVGALVTSLVPLILFRMRAMGGGDVKLFAALGSLLGAGIGLETQMAAFMVGGLQGIVIWIKRGEIKQGLGQTLQLFVPRIFKETSNDTAKAIKKTEIRFAPAILVGLLVACGVRFLG